jgi:antitoxin MazE
LIYLDTSILAPLFRKYNNYFKAVGRALTSGLGVILLNTETYTCDIITNEEGLFPYAYINDFVSSIQVKMATQKLTLEISESLFEELHRFAELTGQSVESLALQSITSSLPRFGEKIYDLDELLSHVTIDNLHGEIDSGEPVGREIF